MKAIVCTKYGSPDVFQLQEVDTPIPEDHEDRIIDKCGFSRTSGLYLSKRFPHS